MPLPKPGDLPRVDRIHHITGRDQRLHPRTPISLDPNRDLIRLGVLSQMLPDQLMQPGNPGHSFRQTSPPQPSTRLILDLHIMVIFSPVIPNEQHTSSPRVANRSR